MPTEDDIRKALKDADKTPDYPAGDLFARRAEYQTMARQAKKDSRKGCPLTILIFGASFVSIAYLIYLAYTQIILSAVSLMGWMLTNS